MRPKWLVIAAASGVVECLGLYFPGHLSSEILAEALVAADGGGHLDGRATDSCL